MPLQFLDLDSYTVCVSTNQVNTLPGFDGVANLGSEQSRSSLGKCSLLHSQKCALDDWSDLFQCSALLDASLAVIKPQVLANTSANSWVKFGVSRQKDSRSLLLSLIVANI